MWGVEQSLHSLGECLGILRRNDETVVLVGDDFSRTIDVSHDARECESSSFKYNIGKSFAIAGKYECLCSSIEGTNICLKRQTIDVGESVDELLGGRWKWVEMFFFVTHEQKGYGRGGIALLRIAFCEIFESL